MCIVKLGKKISPKVWINTYLVYAYLHNMYLCMNVLFLCTCIIHYFYFSITHLNYIHASQIWQNSKCVLGIIAMAGANYNKEVPKDMFNLSSKRNNFWTHYLFHSSNYQQLCFHWNAYKCALYICKQKVKLILTWQLFLTLTIFLNEFKNCNLKKEFLYIAILKKKKLSTKIFRILDKLFPNISNLCNII